MSSSSSPNPPLLPPPPPPFPTSIIPTTTATNTTPRMRNIYTTEDLLLDFFPSVVVIVFVMGVMGDTRKQLQKRCQIDGLVIMRLAFVLLFLLWIEGLEPVDDAVCVAVVAVAVVAMGNISCLGQST